jgi:hypothetical protein
VLWNAPEVNRLPGALGAEIKGINFSGGRDCSTAAAIGEIWLKPSAIVLRDQELPPAREMHPGTLAADRAH